MAIIQKLYKFSKIKFMIWTGGIQFKNNISYQQVLNAIKFFEWVNNDWVAFNDNFNILDYYGLATEGGLYLKSEYATKNNDSHPSKAFAQKIASIFLKKILK